MSALATGGVVLVCVFGSALLGSTGATETQSMPLEIYSYILKNIFLSGHFVLSTYSSLHSLPVQSPPIMPHPSPIPSSAPGRLDVLGDGKGDGEHAALGYASRWPSAATGEACEDVP